MFFSFCCWGGIPSTPFFFQFRNFLVMSDSNCKHLQGWMIWHWSKFSPGFEPLWLKWCRLMSLLLLPSGNTGSSLTYLWTLPSKGMGCSAMSGKVLIPLLKTVGSLGRQDKVVKRKGCSQWYAATIAKRKDMLQRGVQETSSGARGHHHSLPTHTKRGALCDKGPNWCSASVVSRLICQP